MRIQGTYCKDCEIFTENIEQSALSTIYSLAESKAYEGAKIRIMPDVHQGKGSVIGFTMPVGKYVNPSTVGVDIGCTIDLYRTDCDRDLNDEELALIERRIRQEIPFGFNINNRVQFDEKDFFKFLNAEYDKACSSWPEMISSIGRIDEKYIKKMLVRIKMDEGMFYRSLSSVGGGNHYIEIGRDCNNKYTFSIHCGSRNFGVKVCNYWENVAKCPKTDPELMKQKIAEIKANASDRRQIPELIARAKLEMEQNQGKINGFLSGEELKGYLSDMVIATAYAKFNHHLIAKKIMEIFRKVCGAKLTEVISSTHNYIDFNDHILRKGAIRAYKDTEILIPLNMRDGIVVARGLSNENWNCSCSHGAGRRMSRSEAKKTLSMDEFRSQMEGIYSTSVVDTVLDEAPNAYKDSNEIIRLIQDTCEIEEVIRPIINIKDTSGKEM